MIFQSKGKNVKNIKNSKETISASAIHKSCPSNDKCYPIPDDGRTGLYQVHSDNSKVFKFNSSIYFSGRVGRI